MTTSVRPNKPVILILGATGTGKSDLAIQLALSLSQTKDLVPSHGYLGAEVINADAMQLYQGLPVITNKVTPAEQQCIPHHLLDHIGLEEKPWSVQNYVKEAEKVIEEVRSRGKIPIIVGGTSYYVYGLLFKNALLQNGELDGERTETGTTAPEYGKEAARAWPILDASTEEMYAKLQELDPDTAKRWHPKDRRRIQHKLEICLRTGRKASEIYDEVNQQEIQAQDEDPESDNPHISANKILKYDPIIFWLEAEKVILKERLNERVDMMVEGGLLSEVEEMDAKLREFHNASIPIDKTKGIWVSIGYKEMEPWIEAQHDQNISEQDLEKLRISSLDSVKAATRQYAKRQNRFIRIALTNALTDAGVMDKLFVLDCTSRSDWMENVHKPALAIVEHFLKGCSLPDPSSMSQLAQNILADVRNQDKPTRLAKRCETCDKILMNEKEWDTHLSSRSHKKVLESIRKRQMLEARQKAIQPAGVDNDPTLVS